MELAFNFQLKTKSNPTPKIPNSVLNYSLSKEDKVGIMFSVVITLLKIISQIAPLTFSYLLQNICERKNLLSTFLQNDDLDGCCVSNTCRSDGFLGYAKKAII